MSLSMMFPGQGSQSVGMLGDLATDSAVIALFSQASDILGYDLLELVEKDPQGLLNQTEYTQPALLATSVAFYNHWIASGAQRPAAMTGHSLGEWSALVCSGSLPFVQAVELVQKRGQYMQAAGDQRPGAMAAVIGLADNEVTAVCASIESGTVVPANLNCPGQVVVSGDLAAVDQLVIDAKAAGAKMVVKLPVSVASHSPLMESARESLAADLSQVVFAAPEMPLFHNYDVATHVQSDEIKAVLLAQLTNSVRWVECLSQLSTTAEDMIECGPGKVLTGLARRMKPRISGKAFFDALQTIQS